MSFDESGLNASGGPGRRGVLKAAAAVSGGAALGLTGIPAEAASGRKGKGSEPTLVGAIRWDAWVGRDWRVGSIVNRTLSPEKYQFRMPYYASITEADRVLVEQGFDAEATGSAPSGWVVSSPVDTAVSVVDGPGRAGKSVRLHDASGSSMAGMDRTFTAQSRAVTVQWEWKESTTGRWSRALLHDGAKAVVDIATRVDAGTKQLALRAPDGTWSIIQTVADDTWYAMKMIVDLAPPEGATPWVDVFVDGVRKVNHAPLLTVSSIVNTVSFRTNESLSVDLYVDKVSVEVTESVNCDAARQAVMDQEIRYARDAGIDYWAFVYYPSEPLARGRKLYLSSAYKNDVKWCAILTGDFLAAFDANLSELVSRFSESNYQRVLGGRPLLYFLSDANAARVAKVRAAATAAGLPDPYIVVMAWTAQSAADVKAAVGADAVSRYATGAATGVPYAQLAVSETALWSQYAAAGGQVIPTVTTGWDKRPRYDYPVSWEPNYMDFKDNWVQQATPEEIADHLSAAITWGAAHPTNNPANAVLIYAWNEFDEGGWICPTLHELRDAHRPLRLDAIAAVPRTV
ncbi:hypothetical protein ACFVT5_14775 [Streptomyces sp. NPDC058001]|uniref:hypothetical protein n=1 Tax=Streptomyces sp. NPDC058001 TaxID=3346300 RepID=UPI0036EE38F7